MHIDDHADHMCMAWAVQQDGLRGGEFILPDYGIYFPLAANMLWWFNNAEYHGTAIIEAAGEGRYGMACSVPTKLLARLRLEKDMGHELHEGLGRRKRVADPTEESVANTALEQL